MAELSEKLRHLFPLSLNQMNIWALERSVPGTSINNISATVRIQGRADFIRLQDAVRLVLKTDASLRTQITLQDGVPMQYHAPYADVTLQLLDFSDSNEDSFEHWAAISSRTPIFAQDAPLYRFAMCRIGEESAALLVQTHHIISDGWSQIMLCNRIGEAYLALLNGKSPDWEVFPDYRDYVSAESSYLNSKAYEDDRVFWQAALNEAGESAALKNDRSSVISHVGRRKSFRLSQQLNHAIYSFCREHRVAPFAVFYMAFAAYLKRSGGSDRFTIGVPVFNRATYRYKQTTGMFVSTLPFAGEISDEWSFNSFNEQFSRQWLDMLRHQRFPFSHMQKMVPGGDPLFRVMLSYQDSQIMENPNASVRISGSWYYSGYQMEQLCIHLTNLEDNRIYAVDYDYLAQMFSERDIEELHHSLCHILSSGLQRPDTPIRALPMLDADERERVLYHFNRSYAPRFDRTPYEMLQNVVRRQPRRVAVIHNGERITYQSLVERGECIAAALPEQQKLVAVLLPRDARLFSCLVGIMQANCIWLLLSPDQPARRIEEILHQSGAEYLLTTPALSADLSPECGAKLLNVDLLTEPAGSVVRGKPDDLAYVVYTSGSTGAPKGVEIRQSSLVNLAMAMEPVYQDSAVLSLCSVGFDAFLLESAVALLCGRTVLLANDQEKERPDVLAELIADYGLGFLSTTPSRLSALMNSPRFASAVQWLKCIICGGEAFPGDLLQRLRGSTDACIYNQYGPSETTVAVSMAQLNQSSHITIGKPMENCHLYVLDDELQPLPVNVCGELYIGGDCVGRGYRNAPDLTAASFVPSPFVSGEILYKTGDTACWNDAGELELSGRKDHQLKLRGLRIEPQEISQCLCRHPGVSSAAVTTMHLYGQQVLVAYYVSEQTIPEVELLSFAASYLPGYMVPARILRLDEIPLTRNGKLDTKLLPPPPAEEEALPPVPGTREADILDIFRSVLHADDLHVNSNYFLSGGNSLNAMETISRIEARFGVHLMVSDLYACRSARGLGEFLALGKAAEAEAAVTAAPMRGSYPLSATQKSIYLQSCLDERGFAYHMPCAFRFAAAPDRVRLENAFRALIADEPLLRTRFDIHAGAPAAVVEDAVSFTLPVLTAADEAEAFAAFLKPFELHTAPLLHAALWEAPDGKTVLMVDIHHIIGDGQSTPMILDRLSRLYDGEVLPSHLTLHDYTCYCESRGRADTAASLRYWKRTLSDCSVILDLPTDRARPQIFSFRGSVETTLLSAEATAAAEALCAAHELTPYMLFSGVLGVLFSRLSGQEDIILGAPVSERTRPELQNVCGPLMSTLPLRLQPEGKLSVKEYFRRVREAAVAMLDHADCPLEEIISALNLPRSLERNPLYQVLFQVRPLDVDAFRLGGSALEYVSIPTDTAKLDLTIEAAMRGDRWELQFEYASDLFDRETVAYWARCADALLCALAAADEGAPLRALEPLSASDRESLLIAPRSVRVPYADRALHEFIADASAQQPDAPAVIWHGETTTFAALESRACEIAGVLRANGARPGDAIGLVCRRTPELLAALLAVLRCGCAYVPFLSEFPAARVAYMMETANVRLILCDAACADALPEEARVRPVVCTQAPAAPFTDVTPVQGSDPMYILFTSGSTGKPKGVMLPHRAISNLLESIRGWLTGESGPVLCTTNAVFDIFITESLLALAQGLTVVLADEEEMLLPWRLAELIAAHRPRIAQFTPSRLQMCLGNTAFADAVAALRFTIVAGEMMPPSLVSRFARLCPGGRLVNMYGPTEAAVYVTAGELQPDAPVTIGTPLNNCRIYFLAPGTAEPVLPGSRGEICVAGPCLADGYVSRPDLTAEHFTEDPFFPGERMYRTGDVGRLRTDGLIECLGRIDAQVKINGNRVELGEVTEALLANGARQAAAFPRKNPDGSDTLVAAVSPETLRAADLRAALARSLPRYMIPSAVLALPQLPQNANGKADMPRIRQMAEAAFADGSIVSDAAPAPVPTQTAAPETASAPESSPAPADFSEDGLLEIWKQALQQASLRPDVSFFEQGGTSLSALSILSEYFNRGIRMTLAEFYSAPTARAQAKLLAAGAPAVPADNAAPAVPASAPASLPSAAGSSAGGSALLLTGATGFLGAHLLRELLESGEAELLCLLRDGSAERLHETLAHYFGSAWLAENRSRIETVKGDICLPQFGLPDAEYAALAARVSTVCHAAADVRHYAADDRLLTTNVTGTEQVVRFAQTAGAELLHISTASISGTHVLSDPAALHVFSESDLDIGQDWQDNVYVRSKLLAEQTVYAAVAQGLTARVFRIGRLIGRSTDGVFQKNPDSNAFYRIVRGVRLMRALPQSLAAMPLELSPVDVCAGSIVALRRAPAPVFHVIQPAPAPLGQVLTGVVPGLEILSDADFSARLSAASADSAEALSSLVDVWNGARSGMATIAVSSEKTQLLLRSSGHPWPDGVGAALKEF